MAAGQATVTQNNGDINPYSEGGFESASKVFEQSKVLRALDRGKTDWDCCTLVLLICSVSVLIANCDLRGTADCLLSASAFEGESLKNAAINGQV
jgi:hypothetical protein